MAESGEELHKNIEEEATMEDEDVKQEPVPDPSETGQLEEEEEGEEEPPNADEEEISAELNPAEEVNDDVEEENLIDQGNEDILDTEEAYLNEDGDVDGAEGKDEDAGKDVEEEDDDAEDEGDEELEEEKKDKKAVDPNVMPQVNVAVLAKRKWQVKVYPLKPADFTSGLIARVFKSARESLLYLMTGEFSRGKGEMYIQSVTESIRVVRSLMTLDSHFPEINIEVIRKNAEGVIQEKAYMRFDTKMVRMLFVAGGSVKPQGHLYGRKRERVIGSVFVKNLPPGTTKNMLRVMFPFAQEINYNPEKYTDGTARLVLKTRSTVIPCLKAFAKVELGGNILELHPLEKKKPPAAKDESTSTRRRSSSQTADKEGAKTEGAGVKSHTETKPTEDGKREQSKGKEQTAAKAGDKKEEKERESPKRREASSTSSKKEGDAKSPQSKGKERSTSFQQRRSVPGTQKNRAGNYKKFPANREPLRRNKDTSGPKSFGDNRSGLRRPGMTGNRFGNRTGGSQRSQNFGNSFGSGGVRSGRGSRGTNDRRLSGGLNVGADLAAKAEATKDMMILQSQLNMAIKSQLAMLNQTQMAVEQAKRGASSVGLGGGLGMASSSGVMGGSSYGLSQLAEQSRRDQGVDRGYAARSRSRDRGASLDDSASWSFGKRSAAQADLEEYSEGAFGRKRSGGMRNRGGGGGGGGHYVQGRALGATRGGVEAYDEDAYRQDVYALRDQAEDPYGYGVSSRAFGSGAGLGSSGRSGNYDSEGYGYRY